MSVWIELMCDVRKDGTAADGLSCLCWTNRNQNVMGRAKDATRVPAVIRILERQAVAQGWVKVRGQWTCPGCAGKDKQP